MEDLQGTDTSVYVGLMHSDYFDVQLRDPETMPLYIGTGTSRAIISNRVSYFFNLRGPFMTVDTACSSSLVAVRRRESSPHTMALSYMVEQKFSRRPTQHVTELQYLTCSPQSSRESVSLYFSLDFVSSQS